MDTGDTAWLLMSTALVMIMLPGLALFYGGLVRRKNVLSTIMHSFFGLALVSVVWVVIGFSLAFGPDVGGLGLIGNLDHVLFAGVGLEPSTVYATTVPFVLFAGFQIFATAAIQAGYTGLLEGNAQQLVNQLIAVGATIAYAVISTFVIVKVVDVILGIRVSASDEEMGIDLATHGEVAYQA